MLIQQIAIPRAPSHYSDLRLNVTRSPDPLFQSLPLSEVFLVNLMLMISSRRARKVPIWLLALSSVPRTVPVGGSVIMGGMKEGTMGFRPDFGIVSFGLHTCGYATDFTML